MERLTTPGYKYRSCDFMDDGVYIDMNRLREYEDTSLTPDQIRKLKERDMSQAMRMDSSEERTLYKCPVCDHIYLIIYSDGSRTGTIPRFCQDCGQRFR